MCSPPPHPHPPHPPSHTPITQATHTHCVARVLLPGYYSLATTPMATNALSPTHGFQPLGRWGVCGAAAWVLQPGGWPMATHPCLPSNPLPPCNPWLPTPGYQSLGVVVGGGAAPWVLQPGVCSMATWSWPPPPGFTCTWAAPWLPQGAYTSQPTPKLDLSSLGPKL